MNITPLQQQAYDLRQSGHKISEIAAIMGRTPEPVRQWIANVETKIRPIEPVPVTGKLGLYKVPENLKIKFI